jgi:hypothetical protein
MTDDRHQVIQKTHWSMQGGQRMSYIWVFFFIENFILAEIFQPNTPGLYKKMMENIGKNSKISSDFLQDFRRAKIVGLPSQWYV